MKKETIRKLGIALAAILGPGALLYLSGLVAQLQINYEDWLHSGGMTGTAQIAPLQYHPLHCIRHAFTPAGLCAALLILTVGSGVFLFLRLRDRFGGKDLDDRNFVRSKRGTYGTANWMTEKRKKEILEAASPKKARGIILGREENGDVICLPEDTRYNKHVVIYGASGTMKSRGVIRPPSSSPSAVASRYWYQTRNQRSTPTLSSCSANTTIPSGSSTSSSPSSATPGTPCST